MPKAAPKREDLPYRDCVGVVLFNRAGHVFIGERTPGANGPHTYAWQFPQGGMDKGEEPIDAALRELYEETSVKTVSLLTAAPNWILYDLPDDLIGVALKGKYRGQRQKWFAMLFEGVETEINVVAPCNGAHKAEFSQWRWAELNEVTSLIVPFKREAYQQVVSAFADVPEKIKGLTN